MWALFFVLPFLCNSLIFCLFNGQQIGIAQATMATWCEGCVATVNNNNQMSICIERNAMVRIQCVKSHGNDAGIRAQFARMI